MNVICTLFAKVCFYTDFALDIGVVRINTKAFDLCSNISDVYFTGIEDGGSKIIIDNGNNYILSESIHYNYSLN